MPLYTYKCNQCEFSDEVMIPVKKRDKKFPCEQEGCTGVMERDIDMPSFQLKGGGWYKDGYSKKKQKKKQDD
tara:strand:- start:1562 stop:1777 length:216 start_codon:yes stop_codon:yes gene_type:complete